LVRFAGKRDHRAQIILSGTGETDQYRISVVFTIIGQDTSGVQA